MGHAMAGTSVVVSAKEDQIALVKENARPFIPPAFEKRFEEPLLSEEELSSDTIELWLLHLPSEVGVGVDDVDGVKVRIEKLVADGELGHFNTNDGRAVRLLSDHPSAVEYLRAVLPPTESNRSATVCRITRRVTIVDGAVIPQQLRLPSSGAPLLLTAGGGSGHQQNLALELPAPAQHADLEASLPPAGVSAEEKGRSEAKEGEPFHRKKRIRKELTPNE